MGAMECERQGCRACLCKNLIHGKDKFDERYICDDCLEELRGFIADRFGKVCDVERDDVLMAIDGFMDTEQGSALDKKERGKALHFLEDVTESREFD
jgi:hypothetical protein